MSTSITTLGFVAGVNLNDDSFSPDDILAAETLIIQYISSRFPSVDTTPGTTLYDLVVRPAAIVYLTNRAQLKALAATNSILGVQKNPSLANDDVLDSILSNFLIKRNSGTNVSGNLRINVSRSSAYTIQEGTQFTAPNGLIYVATKAVNATPNPSTSIDIQLYSSDSTNTQWYFIVPVTARGSGSEYIIVGQPQFTMAVPIPNLISIFAFGGFSSAVNPETNAQLIARIPEALSAKNLVSRSSLNSVLKSQFPEVTSVGVAGFGDAGLLRGADNIFGIKTGGVADVWVKTSPYPITKSFSITCSKISTSASGDVFQFVVPNTTFAGNYFISSVNDIDQPANVAGSYQILSQTRSVKSGSQHVISSNDQGAYSPYQITTVRFAVPPAGSGAPVYTSSIQAFNVGIMGCPLISEIQDYVSDPSIRPAGMDYLVRAAIPCFVSFSPITIYGQSSTDVNSVVVGIHDYVNGLTAGQPLSVDAVVNTIRDVPGVTRVELPITISGRIMCPDGTHIDIFSNDMLEIPTKALKQVSPDTVAFFVSPDNIPVASILTN
jgi:hypothetical protein